jgi:hypothetical protein
MNNEEKNTLKEIILDELTSHNRLVSTDDLEESLAYLTVGGKRYIHDENIQLACTELVAENKLAKIGKGKYMLSV